MIESVMGRGLPGHFGSHLLLAAMHIEILKHPIKGFQVRVVDAEGRVVRMFTYPTIESARRVATVPVCRRRSAKVCSEASQIWDLEYVE